MPVLATDSFNRADNADLGADWDKNGNPFQIVSNTARYTTNVDSAERNNTVTWPNDQYSKVILGGATATSADSGYGPAVRMALSDLKTYYRLVVSSSGWTLRRFTKPTGILIATDTTPTFTTGYAVELQVRGSETATFVMLKNGVEFGAEQSDSSSPLTTGAAGIVFSSPATTAQSIDSWEGGSLGITPTSGTLTLSGIVLARLNLGVKPETMIRGT